MAKFSKSSAADVPFISKRKTQNDFWCLDPVWSPGCLNPRVESNDVKVIFIFVPFNCSINIIVFNQTISSLIQQELKYVSTTCKTALTTSGKLSKNIQFQNTHFIFSVHSQHLKSSSSAFRTALSNLWILLVYIYPIPNVRGLKLAAMNVVSILKHDDQLTMLLLNKSIEILAIMNETRLDKQITDTEVDNDVGYQVLTAPKPKPVKEL